MAIDTDLSGRVAIVTGAASGIGRATAELLADAGAAVLIADVNAEGAEKTAADITAAGGAAAAAAIDIRDPEQASAAMAAAREAFGGIHILVNNAAAWTTKLFKDLTLEDYERDVGVTLIGTMVMTRAVYDEMCAQNFGRIVNLVSDSARIGEAYFAAYSAAKAGVIGFTKTLAREAARFGVTVNAVSPGTTKTPGAQPAIDKWGGEQELARAYPLRRLGEPIDIANAILFFSSDRASWITGQILSVSGGFSMAD